MPNLCIIPARAIPLYAAGSLTATDIIVLCSIGEHTDRNGEGCWASSKTLSDKAGIGRSTFFACTDRLIEHGLVERESGKDAGRSSTYRIVLDARVSSQRDTPRPASEIPPSSQRDTPTINAPSNDPSNATPSGEVVYLKPATDGFRAPPTQADLYFRDTLVLTAEYADDWNALSDRIIGQRGLPVSFIAEMALAAQGERGYPKATPEQLGDVIRGFNANGADISFRLFKAYLRDVLKPKEGKAAGSTLTLSAPKKARYAATALVQMLKECRVRSTVGVSVGHYVLPANWAERFSDVEAAAIKTVGTSKLLSDDDTAASIALSDLANVILGRVE
jgi:hypothetical protein